MFRLGLLLLITSNFCFSQNKILSYWNREIDLDTTERRRISIDNIKSENDYIKSISYYQLGVLDGFGSKSFTHYENALIYLRKSNVSDDKLYCYILQNQGYIAKLFHNYRDACSKYEMALDHSKRVSLEKYLSVQYSIGVTVKNYDVGRAMSIFTDILSLSTKDNNLTYKAKSLMQLGLINTHGKKYDEAIDNFSEVVNLNVSPKYNTLAFANWSNVYYHQGDFKKQEEFLMKSIDFDQEFNRYTSQVDLGECLLKQGDSIKALKVFLNAEKDYPEGTLNEDHYKIFKYIRDLGYKPLEYADKWGAELNRFNDEQSKVFEELKYSAFSDYLANLEKQKEYSDKQREILLILSGITGIALFFSVIYFFNRRKKGLIKRQLKAEVANRRNKYSSI